MTLVVVATPIGNLGDVSPRAARALAEADTIACEDTRRTRALLTHLGLSHTGDGPQRRLLAVHDRNEAAQVSTVLARLADGQTVVVVSDAGMPAVSDPGQRLVAAASAAGHRIEVIPGPSAVLAALVVSGLATHRFCFEGFLPRKGRDRADRLAALVREERTTVLFEAPVRMRATVAELAVILGGERLVVLARELTKRFEEVWRGTLLEAVDHLDAVEPRGEYVVVLEGAPMRPAPDDVEIEAALRERLAAGLDKRSAVAELSAELGVAKRRLYQLAIPL